MKNVSLDILQAAAAAPGKIALATPAAGNVTYQHLARAVRFFAIHMRMHGVERSSCVAIASGGNEYFSLCSILAVGMIGARWVQATPALRSQHAFRVSHLLSVDRNAAQRVSAGIVPIVVDATWQSAPVEAVRRHSPELKGNADDADIWMLAQSSGTSGTPKFMALSYANYWARNKKARLTHDFNPVITACLFPPLSGPWVSYNLRTLGLGGTMVLGSDIGFFLKHNVQKVFGSPRQFEGLFSRNESLAPRRLPIAHVAGASVSRGFAERILQRFELIHNFYGSTEVGGVARRLIRAADDKMGCVGLPLEGNSVMIADEQGRELPRGVEGRVAVRNAVMIAGYLGDDAATAMSFREGWFYSGDLGYLDSSGELYLTGRTGEVVSIGGIKVNLADMDEIIATAPYIQDGICFVTESRTGVGDFMAMASLKNGKDVAIALASLQSAIEEKVPKGRRMAGVYLVEQVPRNENGKVMRAEAARLASAATPHMFSWAAQPGQRLR